MQPNPESKGVERSMAQRLAEIQPDVKLAVVRQRSLQVTQSAILQSLRTMFAAIDSDARGVLSRQQLADFLAVLGFKDERVAALSAMLGFAPAVDEEAARSDTVDFDRFSGVINRLVEGEAEDASLQWTSASPSPSPAPASVAHRPPLVFLGGSCGSSTWRKELAIPLLSAAGISFYDPQVADWKPELVVLEELMKACCRYLLFVVDGSTRSAVSMVEAAELMASGRRVVLVVSHIPAKQRIGPDTVTDQEALDLNRARIYLCDAARRQSVPVFDTVQAAVEHLAHMARTDSQTQRSGTGQGIH